MLRLLHLSDIHFRAPDCSDPETDPNRSIRDLLEMDVVDFVGKDGKNIDAILITGDIAFACQEQEYAAAAEWIDNLCASTGCESQSVYLVPGNHDIDRTQTRTKITKAIRSQITGHEDHRLVSKELSEHLKEEGTGNIILSPMKNYNSFAERYNCGVSHQKPFWTQDLVISENTTLNIRGMTTVLLSSDEDDLGLLPIDSTQTNFPQRPGYVYLSMMHHPCDWLKGGNFVKDQLENHVNIQLYGHKHSSRYETGEKFLRVYSIALHPDNWEAPYEPGYNIIDIEEKSEVDNSVEIGVKVYVRVLQRHPLIFVPRMSASSKEFYEVSFSIRKPLGNSTPKINPTPVPKKAEECEPFSQSSCSPQEMVEDIEDTIDLKAISYEFYRLNGSQKRKIINELNLLTDEEWEKSTTHRHFLAFKKAQERGHIEKLQEHIEKARNE
ncbi:metallophosphoesterase [Vibrio harveyi]|uniref:metallophosphoesterase n=1 Tax=Vibrio harveyi TaxID=669 RepID=UPI00237EE473|nr:metallophosphoesterase [Vibrio harveyi]